MIERLKADLKLLAAGKPGSRFIEHHERHRKREGRASFWKTAIYLAGGLLLLVAGFLLSIPPGFPGFLLWAPGLALLVARLQAFARLLDRGELFLHRQFGKPMN